MKTILLFNASIFLLLIAFSCNTTGPKPERNVVLSAEDASCTEAWLKLTLNNFTGSTQVELKRNGSTVNTFNISSSDTVLYDNSLAPNKTYSYQAFEKRNGIESSQSDMVNIKTLDTTSSNFTWQKYTFGGNAGSCAFYDCAIVNDTLAYAVGEVYLNDSTGQPDPQLYNLAEWNGKNWTTEKIFYPYQGTNYIAPLYSIYAFGVNDIWVGSNQPMHWNGKKWETFDLNTTIWNGWINKIWGRSSNDLYIIGNSGAVAHYFNGSWQKIESGTISDINDIWGITLTNDQNPLIYSAISNITAGGESGLIKLQNNQVQYIPVIQAKPVLSVWFTNSQLIYIGGASGLFKYNGINWDDINYNDQGYVARIRGNDVNDIFIVGGYGLASHFNGYSWKVYHELSLSNGDYHSVSVKGNIVVMAGVNNGRALAVVGERQ